MKKHSYRPLSKILAQYTLVTKAKVLECTQKCENPTMKLQDAVQNQLCLLIYNTGSRSQDLDEGS